MIINSSSFTLSIIIPCYNEINTINEVIKRVKSSKIKSKQIIILDDFSTDGTREILENLKRKISLSLRIQGMMKKSLFS